MNPSTQRIQTGVPGLDELLLGGVPRQRAYLLQGDPGLGKTTMALQFLRSGMLAGERTLYITLSESREEIVAVAASHGFSLDGIEIYEMPIADGAGDSHGENTLFVPAEIELGERIEAMMAVVERSAPQRVVLDSCSELRLLAQTPLRFRRQVLALKRDLTQRGCTVLFIDNASSADGDQLLQSLVHGVVQLEQLAPLYGETRRRLRILKMREVAFRGGHHDYVIRPGGVVVFPRLIANDHQVAFEAAAISSGNAELDRMLGGGLDRASTTLFLGPAGAGKSTVATQIAVAALQRGEKAAMFLFDEDRRTLIERSVSVNMPLERHIDAGRLYLQQVEPAELSPGELVAAVRSTVEERGASVIIIDSLNGYTHALPNEQFVPLHLHELLSYLRQCGVTTVLTMAQHGMTGSTMATPVDVSYLADAVLVFRYFEAGGRVRKAISVLKKRGGSHEDTIRELSFGPDGIHVGPALEEFRGILTGVPVYLGEVGPGGNLMGKPRVG